MSDTLALDYSEFNSKVKVNKSKVIKVIEKECNNARLDLLKSSLKEMGITFNDSITDYNTFVKDLLKTLKGHDLTAFKEILKKSNDTIDNLVNDLKNGSETAFTSFVKNCYDRLVKPLGNSVTNSLAINTLISLTPTAIGKVGVGIVLTGVSLYKFAKNDKFKRVTNKAYELNKILQELELTKDVDGNITDTRFNKIIVENIKEFLRQNNVSYLDTGYLSLREAIYDLDNVKKEELCKLINNLKGNKIDINAKLKDVNSNFLTRANNKYIKDIVKGGTLGVGLAAVINSIDPGITMAPLNGTIVGKIIESLTNSKVISWIGGLASGTLSLVGKYIPFVGDAINKILSIENLGVLAILGGGFGLITAIGKNIYKVIKNRKENFNTKKEMKQLQDLERKLYQEDDLIEIKKMKEKMDSENLDEKSLVLNLVCQYMDEMQIKYDKRPKNFQELDVLIKGLNKKERKQVNDLLYGLDEYLKRDPNDFRRIMKKVGKYLKVGVTLGLASLSVVDILTQGNFFKDIRTNLFPEKVNSLPTKLKEFNDSEGRRIYEEMHANDAIKTVKPEPGPVPVANPTPTPTKTVSPTPTPSPTVTPTPTVNVVNNSTMVNGSGVSEKVTEMIFKKPKYNINELIVNADKMSSPELLAELSDKELYEVFINAHDPVYAYRGLKLLDESTLARLKKFAETSGTINRDKTVGYHWLKDGFDMLIKERNIEIEKAISEINRNILNEQNAELVAKAGAMGIAGITELNKAKQK